MDHPFSMELCKDSVKTVLLFLLAYGLGIGIYLSTRRKYRRGEEHGSAVWGDVREINRKYSEKDFLANKLMTQNVRISYDSRKHRRNLLTIIIGGSGAGKTRFYAKPNLMQANTSCVVLDPKGENLRDTGYLLEAKGYDVRVLDLINMEKSYCYNPFVYLKDDNDVQRLVTTCLKPPREREPKQRSILGYGGVHAAAGADLLSEIRGSKRRAEFPDGHGTSAGGRSA